MKNYTYVLWKMSQKIYFVLTVTPILFTAYRTFKEQKTATLKFQVSPQKSFKIHEKLKDVFCCIN